jgi:hypothetical protein
MSDTEETEYLSLNSSIAYIKKEDTIISKSNEEIIPIKTIEIISDLLNNICEGNKDKSELVNIKIKPFMTMNIPTMPIKDYLLRLAQFANISESTIILILIYIDRICKINNFHLNFRNIYKLIITSMIIAIKYNEDHFYSKEVYAKLGGVTMKELNYLEFQFLILIKFSLFVEKDLYDKYYDNLISIHEDNEDNNSENDEEDESDDGNDESNDDNLE